MVLLRSDSMPFLKTLFRVALCSIACGASLFCAADVYRIIRNYPELMPVSYMDEKGSPTGFETELIRKIAEQAQLDLKAEFVANFGDTLTALENGKADLAMATISVTPARQQIFDFTTPYSAPIHLLLLPKMIRSKPYKI